METLQHRREHQSLIRLYRYLHNNDPKYIKDSFASGKRNLFHTYWIFTLWSTIVRFVIQSVNLSKKKMKISFIKWRYHILESAWTIFIHELRCIKKTHSIAFLMHNRLFGIVSDLITTWRHNIATISAIEDFRTQFEMFTVCSLLLAVCTNNSIGN